MAQLSSISFALCFALHYKLFNQFTPCFPIYAPYTSHLTLHIHTSQFTLKFHAQISQSNQCIAHSKTNITITVIAQRLNGNDYSHSITESQ